MTARVPGHPDPLAEGELVVLHDRKGRRYLVTLTAGKEWHSHAGVLTHDEIIGLVEGNVTRTTKNMEVVVLRPTREDFVLKMPRGAQVVYPQDQATIVALGDIRPGCTVVEAGAGSGALSMALLAAVGSTGRVTSYERREDHIAIARENVLAFLGEMPPNWDLRLGDVADELAGLSCDRVVFDLLEPWELVKPAGDALRPGGLLVAYQPTVPQVVRTVEALHEDGRFGQHRTQETLVRPWNVDGLSVRPSHRMVAHTAFLTCARRLAD